MLEWLLMLLANTTELVARQCARLGFGVVGTISNITGQVSDRLFYQQSRAIMSKANENYKGSFDLPPYTVESKKDDYEVRRYHEANWVSTISSGAPMSGSNGMFMKLFRYIQGANRSDSMISMTVPVMNEIKDQPRTNNLKMSFYIPNNFQADPPEPNEPSVFIEKKKFTAFVRSFSGYPMFFSQYRKQIDIMLKAMAKDGLEDAYKKNIILYAGYDAPWKMFNRLNEVLLIREEEE